MHGAKEIQNEEDDQHGIGSVTLKRKLCTSHNVEKCLSHGKLTCGRLIHKEGKDSNTA